MIKRIQKLRESEFSRSVLTLSFGTALAQALPILISPILTRLYTPDQFATFGLFTALIGILGIISTGKYEFAIMLPEEDRDAYTVASLALIITVLFGVVSFFLILVFNKQLIAFFNNPELAVWIYFLPVGITLTGILQVLNFLNNREKAYTLIAKSRVARSVATGAINVIFGYIKIGAKAFQSFGLISGILLGQLLEILILSQDASRCKRLQATFRALPMKTVAKRYINFPKFDVSSELMITASIQLPVLLFNRFFEKPVVGFYFHAHRVLSVPMSMLGSAIGQVLFKQLSAKRHDKLAFKELVAKTYENLILIAVIPYTIIGFFGQELFGFVFGDAWKESGVYAQLIAPWLLFNFIGAPLTMIFSALEKQRPMFFWIIGMFIARVLSIFAGIQFFGDTYHTILLFSISGTVFYFFLNLYLVCILSEIKVFQFLRMTFGWPLLIAAFIGLIKLFVN